MSFLQAQIAQLIQLAKKKSEEEPYYEVLEYITLDGTQYFDTEENADSTLGFECRYALTNTTPPQRWGAIKKQTGTSDKYIRHHFNMSNIGNKISYDYGLDGTSASENSVTISTTFDTDIHELKLNAITKEVFFDGVSKGTYGSSADFDVEENYYLGNRSGLTGGMPVIYYVYKLFRNGVLIKDYVPVLDDKMQPCLYDRVTKTFLYAKKISDGTTAYDLGFKRWNKYDVDYLQSDGNAYIPLSDITPTTTMGINIEYAYTALSPSEPAGVFGTYNGDTQRKDTFFVSTSSGYTEKATSPSTATCGIMVFHRGQNVGTSTSTSENYIEPETDVWYTATVNWLNDGEITWTNGIKSLSNICGTNTILTNELRAFGRCRSSDSTYNYSKSRIRKLQISDGSKIIRSFIPSVYIYTSGSTFVAKAFFYDEIYNKAYSSAGTGSLKAYIAPERIGYNLAMGVQNDGYYISATGVLTEQVASCYTNVIPVQKGDIITLDVTLSNLISANKRIHAYNGTSTNDWVSQLGVLEFSTTSEASQSLTVTVPSGVSYIRLSHSNIRESECTLTITTTYEVGKSVSGTPSSTVSGVSNCFDTGLYGTQNTTVKHIAIGYDSNSTAGQLFGSYDGSTETSQNLTINSTGTGNTAPIRFGGQVITTPIKIPINTFASIITSRYGLWVNDSLHGTWGDINDFTTTTTMLILKCNNSTNTRNNGCGYCLILEKGVPVAEYIPVRNASNTSVYGLYDKVSKTLNTGEGTINFNVLD